MMTAIRTLTPTATQTVWICCPQSFASSDVSLNALTYSPSLVAQIPSRMTNCVLSRRHLSANYMKQISVSVSTASSSLQNASQASNPPHSAPGIPQPATNASISPIDTSQPRSWACHAYDDCRVYARCRRSKILWQRKTFLCPPPVVHIEGPVWHIRQQQMSMSVVSETGERSFEQKACTSMVQPRP